MRAFRTSSTSTDQRGYTLVELSVSMAVFLVFMAVATPFLFRNLTQALNTEVRADLQKNARVAMRVLVRDLRQASVLYASAALPTQRDRVSFGVDFDAAGGISTSTSVLEQVSYFLGDSGLHRGRVGGPSQLLAQNVTGMRFMMFGSNPALDANGDGIVDESELNIDGNVDGNGDPIWSGPELANVTRIELRMTVSSRATSQTYTADVWLRNKAVG